MLIYSPNFDPFHTALRLISILSECKSKKIERERLKIFDIVIANPSIIKSSRLPATCKALKKYKKSDKNPYEEINSPVNFLSQIEPFHEAALRMIAGYGLVDIDGLKSGIIEKRLSEKWTEMKEIAGRSDSIDHELVSALCSELSETPVFGKNGLKNRLKLMEYKYDPT